LLSQNIHALTDLNIQFLPELIGLHKRGRFPVDRLVSEYPIKDLDRALKDMESGRVSLWKPVFEKDVLIAKAHQNRYQMGHLICEQFSVTLRRCLGPGGEAVSLSWLAESAIA
jgi:hypothetical protein